MMKSVLLVLALALWSSAVVAQSTVDRPLITVTGQAEILVVPDEAVFSMSAATADKDILRAQARNDEVVKKILALARTYGIPPNLVQTSQITLEEQYSDEEATRRPRVFIGYQVTKHIAIVLGDISKADELLADIFKSGITRISGVQFRTTQIRKYKDQARAMAIKAAQEKANALAREIGQNIGKAYTITEEEFSNRGLSNNFSSGIVGGLPAEESTIALGQISVTARVMVSFELK